MSILIKGMEMPNENNELRLIIHPNGQVIISHKTHYEEAEAVPVPPHGRLKDYDKITDRYSKWFRNCKYREYEGMYNALQTALDDAPTIIPADEPFGKSEQLNV